MSLKRKVAVAKLKQRHRQAEKHEREMKKLGIARNKTLKEATQAAEKAEALEEKRKAEEKKARALAPLEAEKKRAKERRKKQAKKAIGQAQSALKSVKKSATFKFIKGK